MTHTTDCSLKDGAKEDIRRVAECFWSGTEERLSEDGDRRREEYTDIDPAEEPCVEMARDLDMEFLGSGVARSTFLAVPDESDFDHDSEVTQFSQCVVKFARYSRSRGFNNGKEQIAEEIQNFRDLPARLVEDHNGKPPVFNPLKDWDTQGNQWVTQPYAPPPGNTNDVLDRMNRRGYDADDIRGDNVGVYPDHGASTVIDYGLTVYQRGGDLTKQLDAIKTMLRDDFDCTGIDDKAYNHGGGEVTFLPDDDLPGQHSPEGTSVVRLNGHGEVEYIDIYFAGFDRDAVSKAQMNYRRDDITLRTIPQGAAVNKWVSQIGDQRGLNVAIDLNVSSVLSVDQLGAALEELFRQYNEEFEDLITGYNTATGGDSRTLGVDGVEYAGEFDNPSAQWQHALEDVGMRTVTVTPNERFGPNITFRPPEDIEPTPAEQKSELYWFNAASVKTVLFKIAEFLDFADGDDRRTMEDVVKDAAEAVNDQYATLGPRVVGAVKWAGDDPSVSADRHEVEFEIEYGGDYMTPETVIEVMQAVQAEYEDRLDNKSEVFV